MLEMREKSEKDMRVRLASEFKGSMGTSAWPKHRLPELSILLTGKLPDPTHRPPSVNCVLRGGQSEEVGGASACVYPPAMSASDGEKAVSSERPWEP